MNWTLGLSYALDFLKPLNFEVDGRSHHGMHDASYLEYCAGKAVVSLYILPERFLAEFEGCPL